MNVSSMIKKVKSIPKAQNPISIIQSVHIQPIGTKTTNSEKPETPKLVQKPIILKKLNQKPVAPKKLIKKPTAPKKEIQVSQEDLDQVLQKADPQVDEKIQSMAQSIPDEAAKDPDVLPPPADHLTLE